MVAGDVLTTGRKVDVAVSLSDSLYSAVQSASSFYFDRVVLRSEVVKGGVSLYCKGLRWKGRKLKQDIGFKIF